MRRVQTRKRMRDSRSRFTGILLIAGEYFCMGWFSAMGRLTRVSFGTRMLGVILGKGSGTALRMVATWS